jgi:hypothetical protein
MGGPRWQPSKPIAGFEKAECSSPLQRAVRLHYTADILTAVSGFAGAERAIFPIHCSHMAGARVRP